MELKSWLQENLPKHAQLTDAVKIITGNLLIDSGIEYLSISGRTKTFDGIIEKVKRKSYQNPKEQITDISGIRIILFIESDIAKVSDIIEKSFDIDGENSSNTDEKLDPNQVGYRSVHYVCELGRTRTKLPEFKNLKNLKFEFQIRTVLQHAWAELAHDRSYKFQTALPQEIQRKLYLHAGLLEIADKGFSEIAQQIDSYSEKVTIAYNSGNLDIPINSISIIEYMDSWSRSKNIELLDIKNSDYISDLISELMEFGIYTIKDLQNLIPSRYAEQYINFGIKITIIGIIRSWMIIENPKKILDEIERDWILHFPPERSEVKELLESLVDPDKFKIIIDHIDE